MSSCAWTTLGTSWTATPAADQPLGLQELPLAPAADLSLRRSPEPAAFNGRPPLPLAAHSDDGDFHTKSAQTSFVAEKAHRVRQIRAATQIAGAAWARGEPDAPAETLKLLKSLGRYKSALPLAKVLLLRGDLVQARECAELSMQAGEFTQAIEILKSVREAAPEGPMRRKIEKKTALAMGQARLLAGELDKARAELARSDGDFDPEHLALRAMVEHSCGKHDACESALEELDRLGFPGEYRILVDLWRNRPDKVLPRMAREFDALLREPTLALDPPSRSALRALMHSPTAIHCRCAATLAADGNWRRLRECCGLLPELDDIPINWQTAVEACAPAEEIAPSPAIQLTQGEDIARFTGPAPIHLDDVQCALSVMGLGHVAHALRPSDVPEDFPGPDLIKFVGRHYSRKREDPRLRSGIKLGEAGRSLLAAYYTRKYGASIMIHNAELLTGDISEMIATDRERPGEVLRCAHYLGTDHGVAVIYVRDKVDGRRREAVLFCDSLGSVRGSSGFSDPTIATYEHHQPLQRGRHTCWTHAMKAAVTLTRRTRGPDGELGDFLIPDLIGELARRKVGPVIEGIQATSAVPEIAKMAQHPTALAPEDRDTLLRDSPLGNPRSLAQFVSDFTIFDVASGTHMMDYARQKGMRYAELVQIEAWSNALGAALGEEAWADTQREQFMTLMKGLVRRGLAATSNI